MLNNSCWLIVKNEMVSYISSAYNEEEKLFMYLQKEKMECDKAESQKVRPVSVPLKEKRIQDVRYSNVVQRNIVHGLEGFYTDNNRIAIDTMPVTPGMDRSHTISDRYVQNEVANWMNAVVNETDDTDAFWNLCVEIAGEDAMGMITLLIVALTETLKNQPEEISQAVTIANDLYVTVANARFNLRPGNASGNRSTGNYIDFLGPEIESVFADGAIIAIRITEVDAKPIIAMLDAKRRPFIRVKDIGAVVSSTDGKFPGHTLVYEIFYLDMKDDGFVYAWASLYEE